MEIVQQNRILHQFSPPEPFNLTQFLLLHFSFPLFTLMPTVQVPPLNMWQLSVLLQPFHSSGKILN